MHKEKRQWIHLEIMNRLWDSMFWDSANISFFWSVFLSLGSCNSDFSHVTVDHVNVGVFLIPCCRMGYTNQFVSSSSAGFAAVAAVLPMSKLAYTYVALILRWYLIGTWMGTTMEVFSCISVLAASYNKILLLAFLIYQYN